MSKILIVAEHLDGKLNASTARCVSCAQAIDGAEIHVAVLSDAPDAVAAEAAKIDGVAKVLAVANARLDEAHRRDALTRLHNRMHLDLELAGRVHLCARNGLALAVWQLRGATVAQLLPRGRRTDRPRGPLSTMPVRRASPWQSRPDRDSPQNPFRP